MTRPASRRLAGVLFLFGLLALGCGSSEDRVPVYPVKGSVKVT